MKTSYEEAGIEPIIDETSYASPIKNRSKARTSEIKDEEQANVGRLLLTEGSDGAGAAHALVEVGVDGAPQCFI